MAYALPLSFPVLDGNENHYMQQALNSGLLATTGEFIEKFEHKLSSRMKSHQAVALNSGTSSLHIALILLGISPGDEVICQSFTFCASANPIVYLGGTPIFVDSEEDTWNMSPELLEDAILSRIAQGKKPKAIVVVHLFGMPAKMREIMEISRRYNIPVLEDAAEAVGSLYMGRYCGSLGKIGVFSFNGNKIITTGGGGALISGDAALIERAKHLSTQAKEDMPYYHHLEIGYNFRMNNMAAAIGLAQIEKLSECVAKRQLVNKRYKTLLDGFPGLQFQPELEESNSNCWLTTVLIDETVAGFSNNDLRLVLFRAGIETRFLWKPLHLQPVFQASPFYGGGIAENLFSKGLCLPSSENLCLEDQKNIVRIIEKCIPKKIHE